MKLLFGPTEIPGTEGELLMPLQSHLQILETMPTFTAKGLEGEDSADAAPVVEDDDDVAKYLADSEADEDAEATAASASAGEPSSSRTVPVEAVLEISSGEEEFLVAPSHRIMGEKKKKKKKKKKNKPKELERSGARAAPRRSMTSPLKRKAEAAPSWGGSGGIASRLRCSVQWVDSASPKTG